MSPTQRTLKELKKIGAAAEIVERWNPFARKKRDLFGFIDIVALIGPNTIGIQTTSGSNHSARVKKIKECPCALDWLKAGNLIEVWSWRKGGKKGKRKEWKIKKEAITLDEINQN